MISVSEESRRWWILIAMGVAGGLILLDETVLGVALPSLRRDFAMSQVASHWVINAYFLAFAGFAAAGGKLADVIGLRRAMLSGLAVFGLASLAAGFAENTAWLISARIIQGLAAAVIYPSTLGMVTAAFPVDQRGSAIGTLATIGTAFLMAGPLVGGFFTEALSWRWIFWVNVPIALSAAAVVIAIWTDPQRESARPTISPLEFLLLLTGVSLIVFALMQSGDWGWTDPVIPVSLFLGLLVTALFVTVESQRNMPLIEVSLFRNFEFAACSLFFFTAQYTKITVVVFVALYLQHVLGLSPMTAGLCLLVAVVGSPLLSTLAGKTGDKFGARGAVLGGLFFAAAGLLWVALFSGDDSYVLLVPGLALWGLALPFVFVPSGHAMMNAAPPDKHGQASGIATTVRLLGGTFGMAVCGAILTATGSYRAVLLATCGVMAITFLVGCFALKRRSPTSAD